MQLIIYKKKFKHIIRQERTEINSKNFYMDQVIKDFDTQFNKDYNDFLKFISITEEDVLEKVMKIRKKNRINITSRANP